MISLKELELIEKCVNDLEPCDIQLLLMDHGFNKRSVKHIEKLVNEIKERIEFRKKKKQEHYIKSNLVKYRVKSLYNSAYSRAKKKNLDFDITPSWVKDKVLKGKCERTGLSFVLTDYNSDSDRSNPYAPSLDRINPKIGYTKENTQVVINNYNKLKSDNETYHTIIIAKALLEHHKEKYFLQVSD